MSELSQQDLEICYILSRIFDFGTDYKASLRHNHKLVQECKEILQDAGHTEEFKGHYHEVLVRIESREREIALESVREKYIEIKNKILFIKADFSKKDLERLFPLVAWICWSKPSSMSYWGGGDFDFWDKEEFFKEVIKRQKPFSFCIYKLCKNPLMQIVRGHYIFLGYTFGFVNLTQTQQEAYLQKDFCIHHFATTMIYFYAIIGIVLIYPLYICVKKIVIWITQ